MLPFTESFTGVPRAAQQRLCAFEELNARRALDGVDQYLRNLRMAVCSGRRQRRIEGIRRLQRIGMPSKQKSHQTSSSPLQECEIQSWYIICIHIYIYIYTYANIYKYTQSTLLIWIPAFNTLKLRFRQALISEGFSGYKISTR